MLPKVIVYNSVSVDGAIKDFDVDVPLHYQVLGELGADALLAGSNTAKTGIELFTKPVPVEEPADFSAPTIADGDERPLWAIVDSRGILMGLLHVYRRSEYAKDLIMLVSEKTPVEYLNYLRARNYNFIVAGKDHVDYRLALEELNRRYHIQTVVTDSGGVLAGVLLNQGLVTEVHLLLAPQVVGKSAVNLFRTVNQTVKLQLIGTQTVRKTHVLLKYTVNTKNIA